jgi:putative nucleotidyltransferase with HDIG domain
MTKPGYVKRADKTYSLGEDELPLRGDDLAQQLIARFESSSYQPPMLPDVAMELMALTRKADVELKEVLHLLERDNVIAGRVLQIAQSPVYAARSPVRTLHEAVVRLGQKTLAQIFLQVSMKMRVFRSKPYQRPMQLLQTHSLATAHLAQMVCRFTSFPDDFAFTCGLLHDVGMAATMLLVGDTKQGEEPPEFGKLWPALKEVHLAAAQWLGKRWKLPPDVVMVIANHHDYRIGGRVHPLAAVVALADSLAAELGFGIGDEVAADQQRSALQAVGLNDAQRTRLLNEAKSIGDYVAGG